MQYKRHLYTLSMLELADCLFMIRRQDIDREMGN